MGLCGTGRRACREINPCCERKGVSVALLYVTAVLAWGKTEVAADSAGDLRIGIAEVTVIIVYQQLLIGLRLPDLLMRNAVRQSANLRKQQEEDH